MDQHEIARDEETGIRVYAEHDQDAQSPLDDDQGVVKFVVLHRNYINPAKGDLDTVEEVQAFEEANAADDSEWAIFGLWLFDHSGTIYRVGALNSNPFGDGMYARFDSGRVGIIALKRSEFVGETSEGPCDVKKAADAIAESYTDWANGNAWGYVVEDAEGASLDSCWGYVGDHGEPYFVGEAQTAFNYQVKLAREAMASEMEGARPDMHA